MEKSNSPSSSPVMVTDPDDPRIAAYRHVREKDLVGREGRFIAEGEVVLRGLLSSRRCRAASILVAENRLAKIEALLAENPADVPVYCASQNVIDEIAGFHLHRGILALGEPVSRPSVSELIAALPDNALVVGLYGIGNHDNMGGLFRNAAAFGADAVLLASDCCDPFYRKAIRVSVGASLRVPFSRAGEGEDVAGLLLNAGFEVLSLTPNADTQLHDVAPSPRTAVLFGSEGPGLPDNVMARTRKVSIEMAGGFDSLNVATTSGIVLHHLTRG